MTGQILFCANDADAKTVSKLFFAQPLFVITGTSTAEEVRAVLAALNTFKSWVLITTPRMAAGWVTPAHTEVLFMSDFPGGPVGFRLQAGPKGDA